MRSELTLRVNGQEYNRFVEPSTTLLAFLRDELGLKGTKCSCENGECGACTIRLDGQPVRSCLILALEANGAEIITVEGLAGTDGLHPLQQAFIDESAVQCGYCIPGVLMASSALLERSPHPRKDEVIQALGGHLCRCGGYEAMSHAVFKAADVLGAQNQ